ncbi:ATP-binding protein [Archangium sp.]|uniref:AAA family ATPase n=1 Tax=Archangium sp. TaxID=1872627 RepID=UPI002D48159E|nr:ATP-binding protein [Archangium sp.]HYO51385.1 ATP-binding protein [Archangium sp.]
MLIQFRVENHRSLRDEQVLSLVAASLGDSKDPRLLRPQGLGEALLPTVALYGANASGKSNVLNALGFMREAVLRSHRFWEPEAGTPQEPFALSNKVKAPSLYEVDILVEGVRFRYGFVLSAERIEEEWLHTWPHGRKQVLFEREGDHFEFGKHLRGENEIIRGLTRVNSLFLSAAAQNNHAALLPIFGWFRAARFELHRSPLRGLEPSQFIALRSMLSWQLSLFDEDNKARQHARDALVHLLRAADLGVLDIKVTTREAPRSYRGPQSRFDTAGLEVFLRHQAEAGHEVWLPLEQESAGTITLLGIATQLVHLLKHGGLLCVDELEASLHPMLGLKLLQLFHEPRRNPKGAQLLFTTHDTNLLGNVLGESVLRRDQIWFTEKDRAGATHLYPLTDFHPRKEENLERGYLQGRYGAVPFLGQLVTTPGEEN